MDLLADDDEIADRSLGSWVVLIATFRVARFVGIVKRLSIVLRRFQPPWAASAVESLCRP